MPKPEIISNFNNCLHNHPSILTQCQLAEILSFALKNKVVPQHMAAVTATVAAVIYAAIPVVIAVAPIMAVAFAALYGIYRLCKES